MRVPNLDEKITIEDALVAQSEVGRAKTMSDIVKIAHRWSATSSRMATMPKWLETVMLWEHTAGKDGFHAYHLRPGELSAHIMSQPDVSGLKPAEADKLKADHKTNVLALCEIALRHPDIKTRQVLITVVDNAVGHQARKDIVARLASEHKA